MSKMRFYQVCIWLENNCLANHIENLSAQIEKEEGGMSWILAKQYQVNLNKNKS